LLVLTSHGKMIRVLADTVSRLGRQTMGVNVINLSAGDTVASITCVSATESEEETEPEKPKRQGKSGTPAPAGDGKSSPKPTKQVLEASAKALNVTKTAGDGKKDKAPETKPAKAEESNKGKAKK
jgi:DNA gyrase/topoisomerase IV subunit A